MHLTRALMFYVRKTKIPGRIDIGKRQLVKPITPEMKRMAVASLLLERANLEVIGRPYLSEAEETAYENSEQRALQKNEEFLKMRDEQITTKMFKHYTMEEHLEHLNVSKKWE